MVRFQGARHAARIDAQVGERIRRRRVLLGYTQEQLADALEISYQQIQKYESGANRVSAGRLYQIAQRLETPINFFFDGLGIDYEADVAEAGGRGMIDLVRSFMGLEDPAVRQAVLALIKALGAQRREEPGEGQLGSGANGAANGMGEPG